MIKLNKQCKTKKGFGNLWKIWDFVIPAVVAEWFRAGVKFK